MQGNRARDTRPELAVRKLLTKLGYRYRLHARDLPGRPDIVFRGRHKVIFVHGCFWHRHPRCRFAYTPKSNVNFWLEKFEENVSRDRRVARALRSLGWGVVTVWECETANLDRLTDRLRRQLALSP